MPEPTIKSDGIVFDKVTDVYHSGATHEEDQPAHLVIADYDICHTRCTAEYGNPCQYFCPAGVYEMANTDDGKGRTLRLNFSNCVHCKTCDVRDPYQIITWVTPEGGGPTYAGL
jgi:electron-transferring-flavoprotein dehydrogenase